MILSLEHLDPLTGNAPNTLSQYGSHILKRARVLLKNRNAHEIAEILAFINWITSLEEIRNIPLDRLLLEAGADENETDPPEYIGDTSTTAFLVNNYKNKYGNSIDYIQNLEWFEVFAALAIGLLNEGINDEIYLSKKWKQDPDEWRFEFRIIDHVSTWIIEATEAITIAEGLVSAKSKLTEFNDAVSERNTRASVERHKKTNLVILELEKLLSNGKHKSMRNLVQIYCENNPDKVKHLTPYNQIRTLSEGLSNHLRGKRRSITDFNE